MKIFSSPKKLELNKIPTKLDVLRAFVYEKEKWLSKNKSKKDPGGDLIADILTDKIEKIYHTAGIKPLRKDKIKEKMLKVYQSRMNLLKIRRTKRYSEMYAKKEEDYCTSMANLLDFAENNEYRARHEVVHKKQKLDKTVSRDEFSLTGNRDAAVLSRQRSYAVITNNELERATESDTDNDSDFQPLSKDTTTKGKNLSKIIEIKSRYSFSDRGTAAIVNATLKTFDIPIIIDKSKLARAEKRKFSEVDNYPVPFGGGLYYDSRKDRTIIQQKKKDQTGKFKVYRTIRREDHYSFVSEPIGLFLGFVAVKEGGAVPSSQAIISFLKDKNVFEDLMALGNDGTNVNIGSTGGINHFIEVELNRPLHWFVCLLHANEIPMKTLIIKLDGGTTGRNSFKGPIGKALATVDNIPIVRFKKFVGVEPLPRLPDDVYKKLSNDQKYLHNVVNALISGKFSQDLSRLKIGELNHSRWITTASRVCKLYAITSEPSENLRIITDYIVKV